MRSFVLLLAFAVPAFAVPAAAASAAPFTTTDPHPLTKVSAQSSHAQWIRMSFRNATLKGRVLTIGKEEFAVPVGESIHLSITAGSTIRVSSPWDSHLTNQPLMQVTAVDANRTIILQ